MKSSWFIKIMICGFMMLMLTLISCGGGGGGGGAPALTPPAFTDLAGTNWNTYDTVSGTNTCGAIVGDYDYWVLHVQAQSGNKLTFFDTRSGISGAVDGTMSGYVVTYSGPRYAVGGCSDMSASYRITMDAGGTSFTGTATLTCNDTPACSVPVTVSGTKQLP